MGSRLRGNDSGLYTLPFYMQRCSIRVFIPYKAALYTRFISNWALLPLP